MIRERYKFSTQAIYWPSVIKPRAFEGKSYHGVTFPYEDLPDDLKEFADPIRPNESVEIYRPDLKGVIMTRVTSAIKPMLLLLDDHDKPPYTSVNLPAIEGMRTLRDCCEFQSIPVDRLFDGLPALLLVNTYEIDVRERGKKTRIGLMGLAVRYSGLLDRYDQELKLIGEAKNLRAEAARNAATALDLATKFEKLDMAYQDMIRRLEAVEEHGRGQPEAAGESGARRLRDDQPDDPAHGSRDLDREALSGAPTPAGAPDSDAGL